MKKTQKLNSTPNDNFTEYDTQSIMHYDGLLRGFFPASNPIIKDKQTGKSIPINRKMSQLDIQKLNEMYPCKQIGPVCGKLSAFCWLKPTIEPTSMSETRCVGDNYKMLVTVLAIFSHWQIAQLWAESFIRCHRHRNSVTNFKSPTSRCRRLTWLLDFLRCSIYSGTAR